jgi:outer membrane lipoprotein-sorting protein
MRAILLLAIFGALTLSPARAQAPADRAALEEAFREIRTVRAEFLQKRYLPILKDPIRSEGRFFFDAAGSLRWEYLKPVRTVMLQKGEAVRLYQFTGEGWKPEMSPAVEARRMVLSEINAWLQGRFAESKAFSHRLSPGPPARIFLTPREGINKFIEGIEIVLGEKLGVIERIEIAESGGGRMSMEFRNVEINSRLPSGIFENP